MRCCRHGKRGCLASDWITERLNSPLINLKFMWLSLNLTMSKPCLEHMATFHWFAEAEVPETTVPENTVPENFSPWNNFSRYFFVVSSLKRTQSPFTHLEPHAVLQCVFQAVVVRRTLTWARRSVVNLDQRTSNPVDRQVVQVPVLCVCVWVQDFKQQWLFWRDWVKKKLIRW